MATRKRYDAPYSGETRRADGLTVFVSDGVGHERTLVRAGMPLDAALREIALQLDEWPGEWRIDCVSTPATIYRDMQGDRSYVHKARRLDPDSSGVSEPDFPETAYLGRIGRIDLWRRPGILP